MPLFTVVLDYRGGTYVSQVPAADPSEALLAWASQIQPGEIKFVGLAKKRRLLADLNDSAHHDLFSPVLLVGLTNAWCTSVFPGGLVNLIKTEQP